MTKFWISLAALLIAVPAQAVVYTGNPTLGFYVDRPVGDLTSGTVTLTKVRIHRCDNTHVDYAVNASIDPVAGRTLVIAGGDLCGATWFWSNDMTLYGNNGSNFTLVYADDTTSMVFANPMVATALTPYTVTAGSISGTGPKIYADLY